MSFRVSCISIIILASITARLAAAGPDLSVAPLEKSHTQVIGSSRAEFTIDAQGRTPPVNRSIEITGPAQGVKLLVDGGLDFSSMESLAASLTSPGMTDEEKVKAGFYFAVRNFYDRGSRGCDDPLEYVNLWGHSYCYNYALFLNALWKAVGLPTVYFNMVIGLPSGHGTTAVYYDNQWHMYDARMRGYFLNRNNRTVASMVDLDRDDGLIRRGLDYSNQMMGHWDFPLTMTCYFNAASDWYDGYNAHFDNATLFNVYCPPWDSRLNLRRGEKLVLNQGNQGKWWSRKDLSPRWLELHPTEGREAITVPPVIYANGTLEFKIDPELFKKQSQGYSNIRARGGRSPVFQPSAVKKTGHLVYRVRVPYFIPSMRVEATGYRKSAEDSLGIELSTDEGKTWLPLWSAGDTGQVEVRVSTDQTQRVTRYSPHKYSYLVRLSLRASRSVSDAALGDIKITTDLFYRPVILPALQKGPNRLTYTDRSRGRHKRRVTFNWLENTNILFSDDQPCQDDAITITSLVNNKGDTPAENVVVRFFDGEPYKGGVRIGEDRVISRIAPGQSGRAEIIWRAEKRHIGASTGYSLAREEQMTGYIHNTIYVQVDPHNSISESNENNNFTSRALTVYNKANLILGHPSFVDFDRRGDKVLVSAHVRNQNLYGFLPRARAARNVVVRFYDGQPQVRNLEENMIGQAVIPAIEPGEFGIARIEWDIKGLRGRQTIYVVVDPEDKIPELWQHRRGKYMHVKKDILF
ncbi:MAG: CARDB domain-containing protein [Gemmatimonadota bacterium]|nr:CARDB domain-containing protein [Gemmatimonadota bacterium]